MATEPQGGNVGPQGINRLRAQRRKIGNGLKELHASLDKMACDRWDDFLCDLARSSCCSDDMDDVGVGDMDGTSGKRDDEGKDAAERRWEQEA